MRKLAASLFLVACAGGTDTGNPHDDPGTANEGGRCDERVSDLTLEQNSPLGVSAADLVAWVAGTHRETLLWQDSSGTFGPEHGRSEVTIEIEPLGAHFITRSVAQSGDGREEGGVLIDIAFAEEPCPDAIQLDVRLHISTAGGALDETLVTTLEATSDDYVTGNIALPIDSLNGSFEAEVAAPRNFVPRGTPKLNVSFGLSPYGNTGQFGLSSEFVSTDGQVAAQGGIGILARFPADDFCESGVSVAADQSVRGVSVADVLEQLNGASPARIDGSTATLNLSFTSSALRYCVSLSGPETASHQVQVPGRVTLSSSDQRINGSFDVTLLGEGLSGELLASRANANAFLLDRAQANAARAQFGIQQALDFSSYDGGAFDFSVNVENGSASGSLGAYGLDQADCVTNPQPVEPGANGSPGCRGTDRIPLWNASWTKQ
jgi:hypothetical protein